MMAVLRQGWLLQRKARLPLHWSPLSPWLPAAGLEAQAAKQRGDAVGAS